LKTAAQTACNASLPVVRFGRKLRSLFTRSWNVEEFQVEDCPLAQIGDAGDEK
jgi:hypothetical protein